MGMEGHVSSLVGYYNRPFDKPSPSDVSDTIDITMPSPRYVLCDTKKVLRREAFTIIVRNSRFIACTVLLIAFLATSGSVFGKSKTVEDKRSGVSEPLGEFHDMKVYRDDRVGRSYRIIGDVRAEGALGASRAELVTLLKQKAAGMGADAVINTSYSTQRAGGHTGGTFCPTGQHECYSVNPYSEYRPGAAGTAIVFTDKK